MTMFAFIISVLLPRETARAVLRRSCAALWFIVRLGLCVQAVFLDVCLDAILKLGLPTSSWMDRHRRAVFVGVVAFDVAVLLQAPLGSWTGMVCAQPAVCASRIVVPLDLQGLSWPCLIFVVVKSLWQAAAATTTCLGRLLLFVGVLSPLKQVATFIVVVVAWGRTR